MNNTVRLSRARVSLVAQFGADCEVQTNGTTPLQNSRGKNYTRLRDWTVRLESRPGPRILLVDDDGNERRETEAERQVKLAGTR